MNRDAELAAIVALEKADRKELRELNASEALSRLLPTASILWFDERRAQQALDLCESLLRRVPCYELRFRPEEEAADRPERRTRRGAA